MSLVKSRRSSTAIRPMRHRRTRYNIDIENIRRSSRIAERRKLAGQALCRIFEPYRIRADRGRSAADHSQVCEFDQRGEVVVLGDHW